MHFKTFYSGKTSNIYKSRDSNIMKDHDINSTVINSHPILFLLYFSSLLPTPKIHDPQTSYFICQYFHISLKDNESLKNRTQNHHNEKDVNSNSLISSPIYCLNVLPWFWNEFLQMVCWHQDQNVAWVDTSLWFRLVFRFFSMQFIWWSSCRFVLQNFPQSGFWESILVRLCLFPVLLLNR